MHLTSRFIPLARPGSWPRRLRHVARVVLAPALLGAACGRADEAKAGHAEPAAQSVDASARADSAAMAAVRARYPGMRLQPSAGAAVPGTDERAALIRYDAPGDENAYGAIIAVWKANAGRLVWTHDRRGDFPPHRLVWLDADGDGRTDLFFTAGEEDVLETHLFTRRGGADSAFAQAYANDSAYVPLVDLDGDGAPELLEPLAVDAMGEVGPCTDSPPPPAVHQAAAAEYARIAGPFDAANVKLGATDFALWTLQVTHPIRILQVRDGRARDATASFAEHLRWRTRLLEQYRAGATDACRAELEAVIRRLPAR